MCEKCNKTEPLDHIVLEILLEASQNEEYLSRRDISKQIECNIPEESLLDAIACSIETLARTWYFKGGMKRTQYGLEPAYLIDVEKTSTKTMRRGFSLSDL
jgi:hypothetical protein